ncbi:Aorsin [Grifola frondosa]|uniref:tripeptidyl-peptidase II n=1 Tax=Grifola frondosa TaxID=5627 RepID=A0A1C7LPB3_GRIFR|nr:Aorsin [Grifola frondosa]
MLAFTRLFMLCLLAAAPYAAVASPVAKSYHESRRSIPAGWTPVRRAEADIVLPLRIGLVQSNLHNIEAYLLDVSHPDSPNYGNHWNAAQVADTFRPSNETVDVVRSWLVADGGIDFQRISLSGNGGWLQVDMTVDEVERLLGTEYYVYENLDSGAEHIACKGGYELPGHVSKHVDFITPTLHFDVSLKSRRSSKARRRASMASSSFSPKVGNPFKDIQSGVSNCSEQLTLDCLRALYDFNYNPVATDRNTVGVVEYDPDHYVATDMDLFFSTYSKSQVGQRPKLVAVDGGVLVDYGDILESNLDTQCMMGLLGPKQEVQLYQVGDGVEFKDLSFNNFLDAIDGSYCTFEGGDDPSFDAIFPDPAPGGYKSKDCGTAKPAYVISTSYGYDEAQLTPAYVQRQCTEYAKLGLMGTTILYSSGDSGVAGNGDACLDPDGTVDYNGVIFNPTFPAGCPYITSVGGTQVDPGASVTDPESAWMVLDVFYSSGGFSNVFAIPDYQKSTVQGYLKNYPPPYSTDICNFTASRAYPDLSANANNYSIGYNGELAPVSGTSAAAPTVGAILTSINDARLAIGKGPIGFINPAIYSPFFRDAFNDITKGSNPGCGTDGFNAVPGWDPVTGLGTPNFKKLLAKWLVLP